CIVAASAHDYERFAADELAFRRQNRYPPFARLTRLVCSGSSDERVFETISSRARELRSAVRRLGLVDVDVIGPSPPYRRRPAGRWRWQLLVRAADPTGLLAQFDWELGWSIDIDPVTTL